MSSGPIPAQPEKILRALGQVWTQLGEEERHQGQPTVLRACAMTLIVVTDEEDDPGSNVSQTLVELMHAHPSRAIVLRVDANAEQGMSARVFAQCWKPFGKAQQICCEQIEVSSNPQRWPDMGPTINGIIVPDLPVVVWCRLASALRKTGEDGQRSGLKPVLNLATKIIVDTRDANLDEAFAIIREWRSDGLIVADLEWTRLTAWRETLATAFDQDPVRLRASQYDAAEIGYSGDTIPASALYLAAWLERGPIPGATFVKEMGVEPGLTRVTLKSEDKAITLSRTSPTCLQLNVKDQQQQRVSLAGSSFYELMHEELTILGKDPVFEDLFVRVRRPQG